MSTHHQDPLASPWEAGRMCPLHDAVRAHDLRRVKQLLRGGADPTVPDAQGIRPLEALAMQGPYRNDEAVATALIDASPVSNRFGDALVLAAARRRAALVDMLLEAGHPTHRCEEALFTAVRSGDEDVSQMLLTCAGRTVRDGWARSPLHYAPTRSMVDLLIAAGADPHAVDCDGKTPLHLTRSGAVVRALLVHGARVDARDATGRTPLHYADSSRLVSILLGAGADIDAHDRQKATPLIAASTHRHPDCAIALVEAGATVDAEDMLGRSPLLLAATFGRPTLLAKLLEAGANPRTKNRDGQSIAAALGQRASCRHAALGEVLSWVPDYLSDLLDEMPSPSAKDDLVLAVGALSRSVAAQLGNKQVARMLTDPYPPLRRAGLSLLAARPSDAFPESSNAMDGPVGHNRGGKASPGQEMPTGPTRIHASDAGII